MEQCVCTIGCVVVSHGTLAESLVITAGKIIGSCETTLAAVTFGFNENIEDLPAKITRAVEACDTGEGVIILADLFGGSAAMESLKCSNPASVDVITGVNLPMVMEYLMHRQHMGRAALVEKIMASGRRAIIDVGRRLREHD